MMTTTTKATLTSLQTIMAERSGIDQRIPDGRRRYLALGKTVVVTAKALWAAAGAEMATLSQDEIAEIEAAYSKATEGLCL